MKLCVLLPWAGAGVGFLYYEQVKPYLENDQLISVLEDWLPERPGFHVYYPNRQYMSCGLRAFLDYIKAPHAEHQ